MDDSAYRAMFRQRGAELLGGVWSLENVHGLIDAMAAEIAEAQERNYRRWGYLDPEEWRIEIERLKRWIADRSAWLAGRFLPPPEILSRSGKFRPPCDVVIESSVPGATIYYTTDNSSPGLGNARVSLRAKRYKGPLAVESDTVLTSAILIDGTWSDEVSVSCVAEDNVLAITEIMYKPRGGDELEFVEMPEPVLDPYRWRNPGSWRASVKKGGSPGF